MSKEAEQEIQAFITKRIWIMKQWEAVYFVGGALATWGLVSLGYTWSVCAILVIFGVLPSFDLRWEGRVSVVIATSTALRMYGLPADANLVIGFYIGTFLLSLPRRESKEPSP